MNGAMMIRLTRARKLSRLVFTDNALGQKQFSPWIYTTFSTGLINCGGNCYCTAPKKSQKASKNLPRDTDKEESEKTNCIPQSVAEKYVEFKDRKRVVQDVIEEVWDPQHSDGYLEKTKIVYERGLTGVFDIDELTALLQEERANDVCVIQIPKEMDYADYMVIVTARSPKHMFALATFVRKRFKSKRLKPTDLLPRIEGTEKSDDWVALDLGNIILHVFIQETRELMDLETLWTVGSQYDDLTHQKDPEIVQLLNMFR